MGKSIIEVRTGRGGKSAYIRGTRTRVSDIVRLADAVGEPVAQKLQEALPHLTVTQVEGALAHWQKHRDEISSEIAREERVLDRIPSRA